MRPMNRFAANRFTCLTSPDRKRRGYSWRVMLIACFTFCAGAESGASDDPLLDELLQVLEDTTDIATKNRLNADYVPGMVSVLDGRDLRALGMRTVWEAMAMIPGVQLSLDHFRNGGVAVRGFGNPFNSGNIKVMIDGVPMSREGSGLQSPALGLPLEQVERIEFIRGPGASIYGDFAYAGVLNVITRRDQSALFARVDDWGEATVGGRYVSKQRHASGAPSLSVDFAGVRGDRLPNGLDGEADLEKGSLILAANLGEWSLKGQAIRRDYQGNNDRETRERNHALELRRSWKRQGGDRIDLFASFLANDSAINQQRYEGASWRLGLESLWQLGERHRLLVEGSYIDTNIDHVVKPSPRGVEVGHGQVEQWDLSRDHFGIAIQDQYEWNEDLTLTFGVRFDRRDDLDLDLFTPRLAAVWRITGGHVLKAQYAEGYRAPTLWEIYPNNFLEAVDPETVATSEISWIHRTPQQVTRATLFHSRLRDHISPLPPPASGFRNAGESRASGLELEWERNWSTKLKTMFNLSYADSEDGRTMSRGEMGLGEDPSTSDWSANLAVLYRPWARVLWGAHWNYVGERHAESVTSHPEHRLSTSLTLFDAGVRGLDLKLGINNLLGEDTQYFNSYPVGVSAVTYPDRYYWLQLEYEFD